MLLGEKRVRIGGRALDILLALVERPGEVVTKPELLARVWPNAVVDEGNLRSQIGLLRKGLNEDGEGARYIAAVPGRGYRFVASVFVSAPPAAGSAMPAVRPESSPRNDRLPKPLTRTVGREEVVAAIGKRLERRRFVTLVGPGGIGKTTVAVTVANEAAGSFDDGVAFIDLAAVSSSLAISSVVASALSLAVVLNDPTADLVAFLRERRVLLVLDSCEHILEPAGVLAEAVLKGAPNVFVLATSREPLRADGESVHRLAPLETPPASTVSAAIARSFSAVELFVERASSSIEDFELTDDNAEIVSSICRKLDGMALAIELAAMDECRRRVEQALASLAPDRDRNSLVELHLHHALGAVLLNIEASGAEMETALTGALGIAEQLGETDYLLRVLWCLWCHALNRGAFREAMTLADRFREVAAQSPDPVDPLTAERMRGFVFHFLGDQESARELTEYMLSRYVAPIHRSHIIRFQFDQKITAQNTLVVIRWLQGHVDQALTLNAANIQEASAFDHTMSLCNALTKAACPVSLMANDLPAAERFVDPLLARSARDGLPMWHQWGKCFKAILMVKQGAAAAGVDLLQATLDALPENRFSLRYTWVLGEHADGLRLAGRISEGLRTVDNALAISERDEELWCMAELLRVKGELLQAEGGASADLLAEQCFAQSLDWAQRQKVLSWELRTALSYASRLFRKGQRHDASTLLDGVRTRFTEGFESADMRISKQLTEEWSRAVTA